jgi:hypothetical protein
VYSKILSVVLAFHAVGICTAARAATLLGYPELFTADNYRVTCYDAESGTTVTCSDAVEMNANVLNRVQNLWRMQKHAKLEEIYAQYASGTERFADGRLKLTKFEEGIEEAFRSSDNRHRDLNQIRA